MHLYDILLYVVCMIVTLKTFFLYSVVVLHERRNMFVVSRFFFALCIFELNWVYQITVRCTMIIENYVYFKRLFINFSISSSSIQYQPSAPFYDKLIELNPRVSSQKVYICMSHKSMD